MATIQDLLSGTYNLANQSTQSQISKQYGANANLQNPTDQVVGSLDSILASNSDYIQNARQRGMEVAATRGGINSSIAAGASERSALEAAAGLQAQAQQVQLARENQAFAEYMQDKGFNQQSQRQLALMPIQSSYDMLATLQQYAMSDPVTFSPEVISGYSNFFTNNTKNTISSLLSQTTGSKA